MDPDLFPSAKDVVLGRPLIVWKDKNTLKLVNFDENLSVTSQMALVNPRKYQRNERLVNHLLLLDNKSHQHNFQRRTSKNTLAQLQLSNSLISCII